MIVNVVVGVTSVRYPSKKSATHTTTVPLYSDLAGMVTTNTGLKRVPVSMTELVVMSGKNPTAVPFTLQPMIASDK